MGTIANLNYIKNIFRHPCATPGLNVIIETAFPAAYVALLEVISFGCTDIVKMRLGKAPWHTRGMKALIKGKNLGVKLGPRMSGIYLASAPVQAALQWMLYADVATGFVANWMSLIYQQQGCDQPGAGYTACGLTSNFQDAGGPYGININCLIGKQCLSIGGHKIVIPAGCNATITWTTEFKPFLNNPASFGNVRTWLEETATGKRYSEQPGYDSAPNTQVTGGGAKIKAEFPGVGREFMIKWSSDAGLMGCVSGTASISAYGKKIEIIPQGCKPKAFDQPYPHEQPEPPTPKPVNIAPAPKIKHQQHFDRTKRKRKTPRVFRPKYRKPPE